MKESTNQTTVEVGQERLPWLQRCLIAAALVFAIATGGPAGAQAKPTIIGADAKLTGKSVLTVWGRVTPPRPKWSVGIEARARSAAGSWSRIPGSSSLGNRGRFRIRTRLSAPEVVLRPVVISAGHIVSHGQAFAISAPGAGDAGKFEPAAAATQEAVAEPGPASQLLPGQTLTAGMQLLSPDGVYRLIMQGDGNLVLYKGPTALWSTGTNGSQGAYAVMQGDGNLVVYAGGVAKWNSHTNGFNGAYLSLQDDSNLVIYQGGSAIWDRSHGLLSGEGQGPGTECLSYGYVCTPGYNATNTQGTWAWSHYGGSYAVNANGYHNCTLYAAWRLIQNGLSGDPGNWGNAVEWIQHTPANHTPTLGSIAWWGASVGGGFGHVAYVEAIRGSEVFVRADNYMGPSYNGYTDARWIQASSVGAFLHPHDLPT